MKRSIQKPPAAGAHLSLVSHLMGRVSCAVLRIEPWEELRRMAQENASQTADLNDGSMPLTGRAAVFVGLRYLLKKRLSYLAIAGVAVSVGTLIVVLSVMSGFENQLRSVIRGWLSDVNILPRTAKLSSFKNWREVRQTVLKVPHVKAAAPYIMGAGLIRFSNTEQMFHVYFRGVDPDLEPQVTDLGASFMRAGRVEDLNRTYSDANHAEYAPCFIGTVMARQTHYDLVPPGEGHVVLVTASAALERRLRKFAVAGIFETGRYDYDSAFVILPLDAASEFIASEGGVTGLNLKLDDYANAPQVVAELQKTLGSGYFIQTWEEQEGNFLEAVAMERFLIGLIISFVGILAGFCIFAILTMMVYEKRRDIGILKAVGYTRSAIAAVFLSDGGAIGFIGAAIGVAGGLLFCWKINEIADIVKKLTGWTPFPQNIYYFKKIPTDTSVAAPLIIAAAAIACSLLFSLLPAVKAARLDAAETLRFE
jgi:lipoprotein-releasing system permease protein